MRPRVPVSSRVFARSYATRLPERPPYRAPDPLRNNPHAVYQELPDENVTFIHRPPPTSPSPLSYTTNPASPLLQPAPSPLAGPLPPSVRPEQPERPPVSDEDLTEIRRLRREDPQTWTRTQLAKKFNCTPWFVGQVTSMKAKDWKLAQAKVEGEHEANREKWGEKRKLMADIRRKRKEFW